MTSISAPAILAIDTSASLCAAAVYAGDNELGRHVIDIGKGHAERLMAVVDSALDVAKVGYPDIGRVAVAIGPGSFTGIRVGVATARGLALALNVPAIGVSNLDAIAEQVRSRHSDRAVVVALASARDAVQVAVYDPFGKLVYPPAIMTVADAARLALDHDAVVGGSASSAIAALNSDLTADGEAVTADIATYARLAAARVPGESPKPLYLREPDAKPQAGFVVARAVP